MRVVHKDLYVYYLLKHHVSFVTHNLRITYILPSQIKTMSFSVRFVLVVFRVRIFSASVLILDASFPFQVAQKRLEMATSSRLPFWWLGRVHVQRKHKRKSRSIEIIQLLAVLPLLMPASLLTLPASHATAKQHDILVDTDMDTDDFFAILYLLKQNKSEINLKVRIARLSSYFTF